MYGKDFDYDSIPPDRRLPIPPEAIEEPSESNKYGSIFLYRNEYPNEKVGKAIILDFETTGLDRFNDDPIELGFLKVTYANRKNIGGLKVIAQEELNEEDKIVKLNIFSIVEHK